MIQINNLSIARGSKPILSHADLTLFPGEKAGLIGHNGAGKSSFLSALLGELHIDEGSIELPKVWRLSWIDQEVTANETRVIDFAMEGDRALYEVRVQISEAEQNGDMDALGHLYEQYENLDGYTSESRIATILHGLGFKPEDLNRKVGEFSGGWKMRLNLAKVLGSRADLILLDEPTNHLDIEAVVWLEQWIKQVPSTVILVSHDRDFLDEVCTHTVHLHNEKLTKYSGGYSAFERAFAERADQVNAANKKAAGEMEKLQKFVDRFKAKASKAKQAQSRVKRLEKISLIETLQVEQHVAIPFMEPHKSPDPLVVLSRAECGYAGAPAILKGISLEIRPGDRIGLLGANGNGKTTLVKTLVGELEMLGGERVEGKGLVYGYFAQDQIESLDMNATPLQHMNRLDRAVSEQKGREFLARYHFRDSKVSQLVGSFSGGEKSRLALALLAYQRPNLLLLDEPTNHLDIATRQALASSLLEFEGALVMVSHDRHLLESITDTFWRVHQGDVTEFDGDLDDYAEVLRKETSAQNTKNRSQAKTPTKPVVDRSKMSQRLKTLVNQAKKLEKQIEVQSPQLAELDKKLATVDYSNPQAQRTAQDWLDSREKLAFNLDNAESELLEIMVEIEDIEKTIA
jgi:ATP-binding cassette, subfamily F, member 3